MRRRTCRPLLRRDGLIVCGLLAGLLLPACGFLGTKGEEPKGDAFLPLSGVGPYQKEDQDCAADFLQPIFMHSPDPDVYWGEPWAQRIGNQRFRLWFESREGDRVDVYYQDLQFRDASPLACRTRDVSFLSPEGEPLPAPEPVQVLRGAGAPALLVEGDTIRVWYEMEDGGGIGHAEVREGADGALTVEERQEPVLEASETWENGHVGSPSVLWSPRLGRYQMWYEGDLLAQRSVGYATSENGLAWVKRDAAGRSSEEDPGEVEPILRPSQKTWEFHYPSDDDSGSMGTPT